MKDLRFTKENVYCDFDESKNDENIKSGESIGTILGKIKRWIDKLQVAANSAIGKVYIDENGEKRGEFFNDYENNIASGAYSHAEGHATEASGNYSHAEGVRTEASGDFSHAEGIDTIAAARSTHAEGSGTIARSNYQHVEGRYNVEDAENKYAHIIGNGSYNDSRSNALTVDWDGNLWTAGDIAATSADGEPISIRAVKDDVESQKIQHITDIGSLNGKINGNETSNKIRYVLITDTLGVLRKNLLKNTAGTSTQNGITFTYNSDGSVTCNGTATADTNYRYIITLPENTSFTLSGCPAGGSTSTYNLFAMDADTWSKIHRHTDATGEVTFNTGSCKTWHFIIRIVNGQTVSNLTFYPMLRNAVIPDNAYEPYVDDLQTQVNDLRMAVIQLGGTV